MKKKSQKNKGRIFTPKEWVTFLNELDEKKHKTKILYELQFNTGARFNEARNVKIEDIDLNKKVVLLKVVKTRTGFSDGLQRTVPISTKFRNRLSLFTIFTTIIILVYCNCKLSFFF